MFSPRQSAFFMDSKMVSMVASACFCVIPRFDTRMLIKSDLSIRLLQRKAPTPRKSGLILRLTQAQTIAEHGCVASQSDRQLANTPKDFSKRRDLGGELRSARPSRGPADWACSSGCRKSP